MTCLSRPWLATLFAILVLALAAPASAEDAPVLPDLEENPLVPVLAEYYKPKETIQIITVAQNVEHKDDLLVTLFLSRASGKDPVTINLWRRQSQSWADIIERLRLKPQPFFAALKGVDVPVRFDTYNYALRQYRTWQQNPSHGIMLYDKAVRLLVGLDLMVNHFKMQPIPAMDARERVGSYLDLAAKKVEQK